MLAALLLLQLLAPARGDESVLLQLGEDGPKMGQGRTGKKPHRHTFHEPGRNLLSHSPYATGCNHSDEIQPLSEGVMETRTMYSHESSLAQVARKLHVYLPKGYDPRRRNAAVIHYHAYGDDALRYHEELGWKQAADLYNFVMVYPEGVSDCEESAFCKDDNGTSYKSWNAAGTTGFKEGGPEICNTESQQYSYCYKSCKAKKGACGACDWTHCYDDVGFTNAILESLHKDFCIDKRRQYAAGCQNGGQMVYDLVKELPGSFAAVAAMCGAKPHVGWKGLPESHSPVSFLISTGRHNDDMPRSMMYAKTKYNLNWDGWSYVDEKDVASAFKRHNKCSNTDAVARETPYKKQHTRCRAVGFDCAQDSEVVACDWVGGAGMKVDDAYLAAEFFMDHVRPKHSEH